MKIIQKISNFILVFAILIMMMNFYVYAENKNKGTINFIAINNSNSENVSNLEVKVYQIGKEINGSFVLNEAYKGIDIDEKSNIEKIENLALQNDKPLFTKTTDVNGNFELNDLELGVYLFIQSNSKDSLNMQTMLVKIPEVNENKTYYNITVKPKIISNEQKQDENKEQEKQNIVETEKEKVINKEIPYTGVLNWPIPILAGLAIIIFSIGWIIFYSEKSKKKIN